MIPSTDCIALIKSFEGCRLKAYPDPGSGGDPWTVGWGSTGTDVRHDTVWTQAQADDRLRHDVEQFGAKVALSLGDAPTAQHEYDALTSFAYNVGIGNLRSSTLLKLHRAGDHAGAARQFSRWNKASGREMAGLTRRRAAEAAMYRGTA